MSKTKIKSERTPKIKDNGQPWVLSYTPNEEIADKLLTEKSGRPGVSYNEIIDECVQKTLKKK